MKKMIFALIATATLVFISPVKSNAQVLFVAEDVDSDTAAAERQIYNMLPLGVQSALEATGFRYTAKIDTSTGHHGMCYSFETYAYAEGRAAADVRYNGDVMFHEIGHYIDHCYNGYSIDRSASSTQEWQDLYAKYSDTISTFGGLAKWEVYNASEAFAESYSHVIHNRKLVERKAPEIVAYVDRINANVVARYGTVITQVSTEYDNSEFNATAYYNRYPDLQAAFGTNAQALYNHWITYGKSEGRNAK